MDEGCSPGPAVAPAGRPVHEASGIPSFGKDAFQPSESSSQLFYQQLPAIAILDIGRMHGQRQDQAQGVNDHMPLAPLDFLARVITAAPRFSAVLTDWLSMMPAEGVGFLPAFRRTWPRRRS